VIATDYSGSDSDSAEIEVAAGSTDVVLRLRRGGALSGEILDTSNSEAVAYELILSAHPDIPTFRTASHDASFEFNGLRAGAYSVVAITRGGRIGFVSGLVVEAGGRVEGVQLLVEEGATLDLTYEGNGSRLHGESWAGDASLGWFEVDPGRRRSLTVPAGRIDLRFQMTKDWERVFEQSVQVRSGDRLEVVLRTDP
jgi:hypothetical protein